MDGVTTDDADARAALADRYGLTTDAATRRRRRVLLLVLAAVAVAAFVVLAVISTDDAVHTDDVAFSVVDDSAVEVTFVAHMDPGTPAECTVLALDYRFNHVGVTRDPV